MSKIFVGSVGASLLDDMIRVAELEDAATLDEDVLLLDPSLELRMTF